MNVLKKSGHMLNLLWNFKSDRAMVRTPPARLWIETTNRCNLRCIMCPNKEMPPSEKGTMSLSLFRSILDQAAPFVHDVYLHHRGEPLLHPDFFEMVRYARDKGVRTRVHSNATLLTPDKARQLLDSPPDLVSFSIDGFEKDAYEQIRVGATFEKTIGNVLHFLELKRRLKLQKPYVVIEKILFSKHPAPLTAQAKIRDLACRFRDAGANEVIEKLEYAWATEPAEAPCGERCSKKCTFAWYAMVVLWDGTVTPCPQDYWGKLVMGNAAQSTLLDIWNGPAYQSLRSSFLRDGCLRPICRTCDRLRRPTVGGLPIQYMVSFLADHLIGYNAFRRFLGSSERN
jgi:radical SAM protein with 4Fe4S-binding SPASM domain